MSRFVSKLVVELSVGRVSDAILLTHNYTDTAWFHEAQSAASAMCFTRGRVRFIDKDGNESATPPQGQVFHYFGAEVDRFHATFSEFGFVVPRWPMAA